MATYIDCFKAKHKKQIGPGKKEKKSRKGTNKGRLQRQSQNNNAEIDLQELMFSIDTYHRTRTKRILVRSLRDLGGAKMGNVSNRT